MADIRSLAATSQAQLEWMRRSGFQPRQNPRLRAHGENRPDLFMPGPFGIFGAFKWAVFRLVNLWKTMGMPPLFERTLRWAMKSTSLACQNLMIAAEALGLQHLPMEGFDGRRLARFLSLSIRYP